ncbi:hypothetical protein BH09PLA1_BH09PLA1_15750 [soil metagenome]
MAKGKHAAALFEVIHSGKNSKKSLLSTPRWWFKKRDEEKAAADAASFAARKAADHSARIDSPATNEQSPGDESCGSLADPTLGRDPRPGNRSTIDRSFRSESSADRSSSEESPHDAAIGYSPAPRSSGLDVAVDPDRQAITFKVSYTSAIIVSFSVLVAVGLAYLVGQKMNRGPALAMGGQSTEQLRAGPKNPSVLDVGVRNTPANVAQPPRDPDPALTSRGSETNPDNVPAPANSGGIEQGLHQRVLNLNYVVVQSYPDQKSAEEARDALLKANIGCTIEQKLKGWKPEWYSVVGTQGFQRASGAEYAAYIEKISGVSQQFAQRKRSFKAFEPMAYKWIHAG